MVNAPDLSFGLRMGTWVQSPHLVGPLTMFLLDEVYIAYVNSFTRRGCHVIQARA